MSPLCQGSRHLFLCPLAENIASLRSKIFLNPPLVFESPAYWWEYWPDADSYSTTTLFCFNPPSFYTAMSSTFAIFGVYESSMCILGREVHRLKQWGFLRSKFSAYLPHPKTLPFHPQGLAILWPRTGFIVYVLHLFMIGWKQTFNAFASASWMPSTRESHSTMLSFSYFFRTFILSKWYFQSYLLWSSSLFSLTWSSERCWGHVSLVTCHFVCTWDFSAQIRIFHSKFIFAKCTAMRHDISI